MEFDSMVTEALVAHAKEELVAKRTGSTVYRLRHAVGSWITATSLAAHDVTFLQGQPLVTLLPGP